MSYLLDADTCSVHLRRPSGLLHRFIQHAGRLFIPSVVLAELYTWAFRRTEPRALLSAIEQDLLADVDVLVFDEPCAIEFGRIRAGLLRNGITVGPVDLKIASVALVHDITLVTHNTSDYENIRALRIEDWLGD